MLLEPIVSTLVQLLLEIALLVMQAFSLQPQELLLPVFVKAALLELTQLPLGPAFALHVQLENIQVPLLLLPLAPV